MDNGGSKLDSGKLRMDLIPVEPMEKVAEVYTIGCKKYADRNWEKGIAWSKCYAAMLRHVFKFWNGASRDAEDGQHHLASVVFYALALMEYENTHPELDDRPNKKATLPKEGGSGIKSNTYDAVYPYPTAPNFSKHVWRTDYSSNSVSTSAPGGCCSVPDGTGDSSSHS